MKDKSIAVLSEAFRSIITISTVFFAATVAYWANVVEKSDIYSFYIGIASLIVAFFSCIMTMGATVNKLHRDDKEAIMHNEVRTLFSLSLITLFIGIVSSTVFIWNNKITKTVQNPLPTQMTISPDLTVSIPTSFQPHVTIKRDESKSSIEISIN